jgi:hypothetical protein
MGKTLVLTESLGAGRHFLRFTEPSLRAYATKTGSDFVAHTDHDELTLKYKVSYATGRENNTSCITKLLLIHHYLETYEKVLWLDDTCVVKQATPNIFDLVPNGSIAGMQEGGIPFMNSWKIDLEFFRTTHAYTMDLTTYINGGVLVWTQGVRKYISPTFIDNHRQLFLSAYVEMAYLAYIIQTEKLPLIRLTDAYNKMNFIGTLTSKDKLTRSYDLKKDVLKDDRVYIYHVTGFYKYRFELIHSLAWKVAEIDEDLRLSA